MIETRSPLARLAVSFRAIALLALGGGAIGLAIGIGTIRGSLETFFAANQIGASARRFILLFIVGGAAAFALGGVGFLLRGRGRADAAGILYGVARRLSPLYLACFPFLLFRRQVWVGKDLTFLIMVALFVVAACTATMAAGRAQPFRWEARGLAMLRGLIARVDRERRLTAWVPFAIVLGGVLVYVVVVSRHGRIGPLGPLGPLGLPAPELARADNLMWNLIHGGSLFKSLPRPGVSLGMPPTAHAHLIAYALVPFYALHQHPGTLLVLQTVLLGAAALPLFALARTHVGPVVASVIALAYLLYPALHAENMSDFHFLALGPFFLWSAWALLAGRRAERSGAPIGLATRPATVVAITLGISLTISLAISLTLAVREDTALWIVVLGAYFILSGQRPVAGLVVGAAGVAWLTVVDLAVLRRLGGTELLLGPYASFVPPGQHGVAGVLATVLANPGLIASTVADMPRLVYLLQMLLPVAFLPMRRPLWLLFFLPAFLLTLLPVETVPIRSLGSPYGAHWIAFVFPGVALGIEGLQRRAAPGTKPHLVAVVALICATIPLAYQFSP